MVGIFDGVRSSTEYATGSGRIISGAGVNDWRSLAFCRESATGQPRSANEVRERLIDPASGASEAEAERKLEELERDITALRAQGGEMEARIQQKERELEALRLAARSTKAQPAASQIATFILSPGLTRGTDQPEKLIISAAARSIQIQLDLEREEDYQSFVAEIRTARGNLAWSNSGLALKRTSYGQAVFLTIPARLISNGEYEVALKGAARRQTRSRWLLLPHCSEKTVNLKTRSFPVHINFRNERHGGVLIQPSSTLGGVVF